MKLGRTNLGESRMNMTPMIDIVFQILIFFMVVTEFANQTLEEVKLPEAPNAEEMLRTPRLVINIRMDKNIADDAEIGSQAEVLINRKKYSIARKAPSGMKSLKSFLTAYVEALDGGEPEVQVRADARVHFSHVQRVIYIVSRCQIAKVSFAADREGGE